MKRPPPGYREAAFPHGRGRTRDQSELLSGTGV